MKKKKTKKFDLAKAVKKTSRECVKGLNLSTRPHGEEGYDRKKETRDARKEIDEE